MGADVWQIVQEIVARVGGDAGTPGLRGPDALPPAEKPRRLAVLETAGWERASAGARQQLNECVMRLKSAGIEIRTRHNDDKVAALETDLVNSAELSHRCNGFETRWFFRSMRERDIAKALSRNILERAQKYEDMTLAEHRPVGAATSTRQPGRTSQRAWCHRSSLSRSKAGSGLSRRGRDTIRPAQPAIGVAPEISNCFLHQRSRNPYGPDLAGNVGRPKPPLSPVRRNADISS